MGAEASMYRRMMGALLEFLTHADRNAQLLQLAADERQLELEIMMGRVSREELAQRTQELMQRVNALKKKRSGGDGR